MSCTAPNLHSRTFTIPLNRGGISVETCYAITPLTEYERLHACAPTFLTPPELAFFENLTSPARQMSYLLGRFTAKLALGKLLNEPRLHEIGILSGVFGQPDIVYRCDAAPGVSISHCDGFAAAIAFPGGHPCGIDIESVSSAQTDTMESHLSEAELKWAAQSKGGLAQNCALAWTAKEALSKVLKCGWMSPVEILELSEVLPLRLGQWEAHYRNFPQYKSLIWTNGTSAVALALPRKSETASHPAVRDMLF